jgi:hypothetical protein
MMIPTYVPETNFIYRVFIFILKVGVEESIVNPLYGLRISCLNLTFLHELQISVLLTKAMFMENSGIF